MLVLMVALGGAFGAVARYGLSGWVQTLSDTTFPLGTLVVNVVGSFLLGLLLPLFEGLAWSGHGKIKRVDVSFDGGINWRQARLKGMVLSKALTRFSLDWTWDGSPALIQSRSTDESGYVQPTFTQLRAARGNSSIYHKNAIHTWRLHADGSVTNVQLS